MDGVAAVQGNAIEIKIGDVEIRIPFRQVIEAKFAPGSPIRLRLTRDSYLELTPSAAEQAAQLWEEIRRRLIR